MKREKRPLKRIKEKDNDILPHFNFMLFKGSPDAPHPSMFLNGITTSCRVRTRIMRRLAKDPRVSPLQFSPLLTFMFCCKADDRGETMQARDRWARRERSPQRR